MHSRQETFETKMAGLVPTGGLVQEIKANCSYSDIWELCFYKGLKIAKKFSDVRTEANIIKYRDRISLGDVAKLATFLQSVTLTRKINPFDTSTLITDAVKAVTIGEERVVFHKATDQTRNCEGGILGGIDAARSLATIMSASVKLVQKKKEATKENKVLTYHADNKYAPGDVICTSLRSVSVMTDASADEIKVQSDIISGAKDPLFKALIDIVGPVVPTVLATEDGKKVEKHLAEYSDDRTFSFRKSALLKQEVQGEYTDIAPRYNVFHTGSRYPPMKRIGRNMWTGTPSDTLNADHVIALHDAGVPINKRILVVSSDTNIISAIRANFGSGCYGIGRGCGLVSEAKSADYNWDYVYYPKPVIMNSTGNFDNACLAVYDTLMKMMKIYGNGKIVCHLSPLMMYCRTFCEKFGLKPETNPDIAEWKSSAYRETEEEKEQPTTYLPTDCTLYPPGNPPLLDEPFTKSLHAAMKDMDVKTFPQMTWGSVSKLMVPMKLTQMSYTGTMLFGGEIKPVLYGRALGSILGHLRDVYKSLWGMTAKCPHSYKIRKMIRGAVVENLLWEDEWSALYSKDVQKMFDDENEKEVAQAEVLADQGQQVFENQQNKVRVDVNKVIPGKIDNNLELDEEEPS